MSTNQTETGFLEESPGVFSMSRLIELLTFLLIAAVVLTLCVLALKHPDKPFTDLPGGVASLLGAMFVAAVSGKVTQAVFGEKTATVTTPPPA